MATHSSILTWEIPWTEEPAWLQAMVLQRVRHNWAQLSTLQILHTVANIYQLIKYVIKRVNDENVLQSKGFDYFKFVQLKSVLESKEKKARGTKETYPQEVGGKERTGDRSKEEAA